MGFALRVVINDLPGTGRVQRRVLSSRLEKLFPDGAQICWVSDLRPAHRWRNVDAAPAKTLWAKYWALMAGDTDVAFSVYLDANIVIQRSAPLYLDESELPEWTADRMPFGEAGLMIVRHGAFDAGRDKPEVAGRFSEGYVPLFGYRGRNLTRLPAKWSLAFQEEDPDALFWDCRPIQRRPWYRAFTPEAPVWYEQLEEELRARRLTREDVERDVREGLARPSLLFQLDHGIADSRRLPPGVEELDLCFDVPELSLSQEQRRCLRSRAFYGRQAVLRAVNVLKTKGVLRLLLRLPRHLLEAGRSAVYSLFARAFWSRLGRDAQKLLRLFRRRSMA